MYEERKGNEMKWKERKGKERRGLSQICVTLYFSFFFFPKQHNQKESFIHVQLPAPASRSLLATDRKVWPAVFLRSDMFGEKLQILGEMCTVLFSLSLLIPPTFYVLASVLHSPLPPNCAVMHPPLCSLDRCGAGLSHVNVAVNSLWSPSGLCDFCTLSGE